MKLFIKIGIIISLITLSFTSCEKNEITSISLSSKNLNLTLGEIDSLFADVKFTGDITPSVVWTVDNPNIVVVSEGQVTAKNAGTTVVTAKSGDKVAKCEINVTDIINPKLVKGEMVFYGDYYNIRKSNNVVIYLFSVGVNYENPSKNDEIFFLEMNIPIDVKNHLPASTYHTVEFDVDLFAPYTLVPASYQVTEDGGYQLLGTWYLGRTSHGIVSGNAKVTINNGINYTIKYDFVDYFGNKIKGFFLGNLIMYNSSMSISTNGYNSPEYPNRYLLRSHHPERIIRQK